MAVNGCRKGKAGEREAAKAWRDAGLGGARRGRQYSGLEGRDLVLDVEGVHPEVKRTEALSLYEAVEQAARDARPGEVPIVLHRRNRKPWLVIFELALAQALVARLTSHTPSGGPPPAGARARSRSGPARGPRARARGRGARA